MSNFEKIDDYLTNRLPAGERASFEQMMAGDTELRKEVALQEKIIRSVQHARTAELKHLLQQAPVPVSGWSAGQIASGVIAAGVLTTSLYFFFSPDAETIPAEVPVTPEVVDRQEVSPDPANQVTEPKPSAEPVEEPKKKTSTQPKQTPTPVQKPDIQVSDPTTELQDTQDEQAPVEAGRQTELTVSKLHVVTQAGDKKYSFHYQFADGKLHLFGPFDRNLYEILEINGDSHAVFLFYKENYYLLDEEQTGITALSPIRDGQLLKKLREYRSR